MSFSAVTSYSNNKDSIIFGQSCEDLGADFFDQFLAFDPIDNEGPDYPALPKLTHLETSFQQNDIGGTSSSLRDTEVKESTAEEPGWNWVFSQKSGFSNHISASGSHFYSELSRRGATSDSELLSLENISLGSPIFPLSPQPRANSLPSRTSTPPPTAATIARRKACSSESIPKTCKKAGSFDKSLKTPIRKTSKMVRCSESFQNSMDIWGNKLNANFHFDFEHPMILQSPPQSARVSDTSEVASSIKVLGERNDDLFAYSNGMSEQFNGRTTEYDTPRATPGLDCGNSRKTSGQQPFTDLMQFPQTPQFHQRSGTWSSIPGSSDFNHLGALALPTPETGAPTWWNHAATAPMANPSPTPLHINPQRASRSLTHQLQNDLPYDANGLSYISSSKTPTGLMIQMPESPAKQSFVITSPSLQSPHMSQQDYFGHSQPPQPRHQYASSQRPYVPGSAHPQHSGSMRKRRPALRHSESPSPKTTSSTFHVRKSREPKSSEKTQRTPSTGAMDFVNFTPNDSRKILTGVAPSGSSKTKARREKEAMEKRRKLGMAALRAIRAAGGDVESLVQQGLFV